MIPRIIHFIYGLKPDFGGKPFSFVHWAAVKTAIRNNPDYRVIFWYSHRPQNHYFDDIAEDVELRQIEAPTEIFGRPLCHVAHQADVVRLQALNEYGGIYLDMDTVTVASFDDLLNNSFVMGEEMARGELNGLCNAIMMAEKGSHFGKKWLETYNTFRSRGRDQYWNEHSVKLPLVLSKRMPDHLTILPQTAFFYPTWTQEGLEQMFVDKQEFPDAYAHHLWEANAWGALSRINENNVFHIENSYTHILRQHIRMDIESLHSVRKRWVHAQFESGAADVNLGSGSKWDIHSVNVDLHPESGADVVFDLTKGDWPIPDNAVRSVRLHHVLEHLAGDMQTFFTELYRVCGDGAEVDIHVPHPRHDWYLIDPTHVTPWHQESFEFLDRRKCMSWYFSGDAKTPLALYWGIDFEVKSTQLIVPNNGSTQQLVDALGSVEQVKKLMPYLNNVVGEIQVNLGVRKVEVETEELAPQDALKEVFSDIYNKQLWNNGDSSVPLSGPGSALVNTRQISDALDSFVGTNAIQSILDLGCGDLTWMQHADFFRQKRTRYTGVDIVGSVIADHQKAFPHHTFVEGNILNCPLPQADLIVIRDVIFHLEVEYVQDLLARLKGLFKYICITSCMNTVNTDEFDRWRFSERNLRNAPFNIQADAILSVSEVQFNRSLLFFAHDDFYGISANQPTISKTFGLRLAVGNS